MRGPAAREALAPLRAMLDDEDEDVREAARQAMDALEGKKP